MDEWVQMVYDLLPEGWSTDADTYGAFDCTFTCPCGNQIEIDGTGPCGCVSPMRQAGLV